MKKIILTIAIMVIAGVFIANFYLKSDKEKGLTLVLDYGNKKQSFQVPDIEEKRAWSLLQQVAAVSDIDLEISNDLRPQKIDGFSDGTDNKHWVLYVNGIKKESFPLDTLVVPPSEVVFRFE